MSYEISEVKVIRKKLGMTQSELASRAGVSQSLIAKIEAGLIDPTYSKAKKIIDALGTIKAKEEQKLSDVMQKKIIHAEPSTRIKEAISMMKRHNISQMPVMHEGKCVGLVTEAIILDSLFAKKPKEVGEIMAECPPIVSKNASISVASDLLRHYPTILVSEHGKITGIVTKSDVLIKLKI
jgi:predicted transcriptional regulator